MYFSTAAGPAFEVTNIHHGMRAETGAISRVRINHTLETELIGEVPARGICGSGLVDTVAELLRLGLLDSSGCLIRENGQNSFFVLFPCEKCAQSQILITQMDLSQLQLAKGAILAGSFPGHSCILHVLMNKRMQSIKLIW